MSFGTASMGTRVNQLEVIPPAGVDAPRQRRGGGGRPPQTHDCGKYGVLSVAEIAAIAGVTTHAIRGRLRHDWHGARLCTTGEDSRRIGWRKRGCNSPTMVTACRLALAFPNKLPTADQIRAIHPMTRDNATRWRSAIRDARLKLGVPL